MKKLLSPLGLAFFLAVGCSDVEPVDGSTTANTDATSEVTSSGQRNPNKEYPDNNSDLEDDCLDEDATCAEVGAECGIFSDGCGTDLSCGSCAKGFVCENYRCVSPCDPNPCHGADSICTVTAGGFYCSCEPGFELDQDGNCVKMSTMTIRLMAANTTSTNKQSYAGPGIRMFLGLKPDIIMIQEFNYDKKYDSNYKFSDIDEFVYGTFGPEFSYHRGDDGSGYIPNGVISRFPIKESGTWVDTQVANRAFEWARIDIPGDKDLWVISVHLLTTTSKQPAEAKALVSYINQNVPSGDYVAIGGDFNTTAHTASALKTLNSVVVTQISGGYAKDQNGNESTNANRNKPYDGVYVSKELHNLETPVTISGHKYEYKHGLVFDSKVFTPLTAVSPVQKDDSHSGQMQHMPVIRDFKLW